MFNGGFNFHFLAAVGCDANVVVAVEHNVEVFELNAAVVIVEDEVFGESCIFIRRCRSISNVCR